MEAKEEETKNDTSDLYTEFFQSNYDYASR